jgi:uncharacterized iron-regulated protein
MTSLRLHKTKVAVLIVFALSVFGIKAQNKLAYNVFDKHGNSVNYNEMLEQALKFDIILFGELHNNPIAHWLQIELTSDLFNEFSQNLILGAEMFETDNQLILNEYLSGKITERNFKAEAKLWNNYETDYKPLVEFAKKNNLAFVATNIPRRYASIVHRQGFDGLLNLEHEAFNFFPPLPIPYDPELPGYKAMISMMGMDHANENLPKAQAVKDATMALFILKNLSKDMVFLHFNGAYHSNNYEGIVWYLQKYGKSDKIMTISTVEQKNVDALDEDNFGQADFIIAVPESMTKTY